MNTDTIKHNTGARWLQTEAAVCILLWIQTSKNSSDLCHLPLMKFGFY